MTSYKTLFAALLIFIYSPIFAQMGKGNYSLGGDVGLWVGFNKNSNDPQLSVYDQATILNGILNPSINKFVSDKFLLGIRPILSGRVTNYQNVLSPSDKGQIREGRIGLELSGRYYFNTSSKIKVFSFAKASLDFGSKKNSNLIVSGGGTINHISEYLNYKAGFGCNYFLNKDVALETTLTYFHEEMPYFSSPTFDPNYPRIARTIASDNLMLQFKMNNFINFAPPKEQNDATEYITKGRRTLGGNLWFWKRKEYSWKTNYRFTPQFSQFITNRLMLRGDFGILRDDDKDPRQFITGSLTVRYYLPFRNRLFFYPAFNMTYSTEDNYSPYFGKYNNFSLGFGSSYFLSDNIALDATLLQARTGDSFKSLFGIGNISLLYFIR